MALVPSAAQSSTVSHPFGLGIMLGEPSGVSGKYWLEDRRAVDFGLAYSVNSYELIFVDYLFHFPKGFGHANSEFIRSLNPYVGIGALIAFSSQDSRHAFFENKSGNVGLGLRIPFGLEWMIPRSPIGLFVELVPGIGLIPGTSAILQGAIGARWFF